MKPLFDVAQYVSDEAFAAETEAIFRRLWLLAAITPMLAAHNDFRTLTLAGEPLVLQNGNGVIRAFSNICRHRGAAIQTEEFGNRPLVCPYHHWRYDAEGRLAHLHKDPAVFGLSPNEVASISLREFKVAVVGSLVFVNLADDPMPIDEQFDAAMIERLASATSLMDTTYVYTRYACAFNWKTGMENIKDPLHVQVLHRATFPESMRIDLRVADAPDPVASSRDRVVPLPMASTVGDVVIDTEAELEWQPLVEHLESKGLYRQFGLFPNVNLMIVDGTSFAIQIYNPLAAGSTEIQMMVALTRSRPDSEADFGYKPVVLWEHLKSDMTVLQEDIDCLEALQRNLCVSTSAIIHGAYETGILDFQAAVLTQLRAAAAAVPPQRAMKRLLVFGSASGTGAHTDSSQQTHAARLLHEVERSGSYEDVQLVAVDATLESAVAQFDKTAFDAIVCSGPAHLNQDRLSSYMRVRRLGFTTPAFVSVAASVDSSVKRRDNVFIDRDVRILAGANIGANCWIMQGAEIGASAKLGSSCWISEGCRIGSGASIGRNCTLGPGVVVEAGVALPAWSFIMKPINIAKSPNVPMFIDDLFRAPVLLRGLPR